MKPEMITPYDTADYLKSDAAALGNILRARNVSQVARETGLTREGLYKAFSPEGNPSFATVMRVADALGLRLSIAHRPAETAMKPAPSRRQSAGKDSIVRAPHHGMTVRRSKVDAIAMAAPKTGSTSGVKPKNVSTASKRRSATERARAKS